MRKLVGLLVDVVSIPAFIILLIIAMVYAGILFIVELKGGKL